MNQLVIQRPAFRLVAMNHVHHVVISGETKWLVKGSAGKRGAQKQFVPVPTHEILMRAMQFRRNLAREFLEPLVLNVEGVDDTLRDSLEHLALLFGLLRVLFFLER